MSFLWYPSPKEKPISSLLGVGGGIGSNLISGEKVPTGFMSSATAFVNFTTPTPTKSLNLTQNTMSMSYTSSPFTVDGITLPGYHTITGTSQNYLYTLSSTLTKTPAYSVYSLGMFVYRESGGNNQQPLGGLSSVSTGQFNGAGEDSAFFYMKDGGAGWYRSYLAGSSAINVQSRTLGASWVHIRAICDGGSRVKLYENGVEVTDTSPPFSSDYDFSYLRDGDKQSSVSVRIAGIYYYANGGYPTATS